MFKHANTPTAPEQAGSGVAGTDITASPMVAKTRTSDESVSNADLKELLEKNLKWSQIIYEQNRKIHSKLLWTAVASWIRIAVIAVPIILAFIFLPPLLKDIWGQYGELLGITTAKSGATSTPQSMEGLLKFFNLDPAKQEQIKALLK
jgi:hypothetical protein